MSWLFGGAIASMVLAAWQWIRSALQYVGTLVVYTTEIDLVLADCLEDLLLMESRRFPLGIQAYQAMVTPMRGGASEYQAFTFGIRPGIYYWRRRLIMVTGGTSGSSEPMIAPNTVGSVARKRVHFIRGTLRIEDLLKAAVQSRSKRDASVSLRFYVRVVSGTAHLSASTGQIGIVHRDETHGEQSRLLRNVSRYVVTCDPSEIGVDERSGLTLSELVLSEDAAAFVARCRWWLQREGWYRDRLIPWRLGAYLHGPPGSGKTSLVRAIGREFDLPVSVFDLSTFTNEEFRRAWSDAVMSSPGIVLLEDIDTVFKGRTPVHANCQLTFDTILQCISGLEDSRGVITIVTTNWVDNLDKALIRPGRVEHAVHCGLLDAVGIRTIAQRILGDWPELVDEVVASLRAGATGAEVQMRCLELVATKLQMGAIT